MHGQRILLASIIALVAACANGDGSDSVGDKFEWSILKGAEIQGHGKIPASPEFTTSQGYELMAVPSLDGKARIWVMLWPESPPFYKQMPAGNFSISREFWLKLQADHKVSSTVSSALRSHVSDDT